MPQVEAVEVSDCLMNSSRLPRARFRFLKKIFEILYLNVWHLLDGCLMEADQDPKRRIPE